MKKLIYWLTGDDSPEAIYDTILSVCVVIGTILGIVLISSIIAIFKGLPL